MGLRFKVILVLNMISALNACTAASTAMPVRDAQGTFSLETRTEIEGVDIVRVDYPLDASVQDASEVILMPDFR